ncbi:hypothetical protein IFM12275_59390 [Nocardia sputorum]|nr:hypothetical protein IFM12275_59390 [Nocardia sputorum]
MRRCRRTIACSARSARFPGSSGPAEIFRVIGTACVGGAIAVTAIEAPAVNSTRRLILLFRRSIRSDSLY